MKIGLAQIDTRIGDFAANHSIILEAWAAARAGGADLVVFPELCVTGYPPRDLLFDPDFVARALTVTQPLAAATAAGPPLIIGTIAADNRQHRPGHPGLHNVAALLQDGRIRFTQPKRLLPSYGVFHEPRWFNAGTDSTVVEIAGKRFGLLVCEDLWDKGYPEHPGHELRAAGAEALIVISASPFRDGIADERLAHARRLGGPLVYVNAAGANDECIFDGGSFVLGADGAIRLQLARFSPALAVVDLDTGSTPAPAPEPGRERALFQALVTGVAGFARKNGLRRAFVGLSGGIDSALVACIAKEALGAHAVTAVALPSRYSDPRSTQAAAALASALGSAFEVVSIEGLHDAATSALNSVLAGATDSTVDENLQARVRAVVLMAFVNRHGGLLLNTSNKTELALGYGTLYGDMAGSLAVIGDVHKPDVYALARCYDPDAKIIPPFVFERPPSAELRPEQVDPFDYPRIAPLVDALMRALPPPAGADPAEIEHFRRLIRAAEHKRWQAGIVLRISDSAFGSGRMVPVTRA